VNGNSKRMREEYGLTDIRGKYSSVDQNLFQISYRKKWYPAMGKVLSDIKWLEDQNEELSCNLHHLETETKHLKQTMNGMRVKKNAPLNRIEAADGPGKDIYICIFMAYFI
jgi:hypothetical protein